MRARVVGVLTLLLLAPVTAELLQAYLGDLGGPGGLVFFVVFFAPLYGGIALLIREVSVRTGRGWAGRLLLAAAFGVAMATIIDLSLFTPERSDIDDWHRIHSAAGFAGIGWYAVVTWVGGHVLMSVGVPSVVAEALARRPQPWLGRTGLAVTVVGFLALAVFVHQDQAGSARATAGPTQYAGCAAVAAVLVAAALSPLGRPMAQRPGPTPRPAWCLVLGLVAMAGFDLVPISWVGVAVDVAVLLVAGLLVARWARAAGWTVRHLAALAYGALVARTLLGFTTPLPQAATEAERLGQNAAYAVRVLLLGWALERRTRPGRPQGVESRETAAHT